MEILKEIIRQETAVIPGKGERVAVMLLMQSTVTTPMPVPIPGAGIARYLTFSKVAPGLFP